MGAVRKSKKRDERLNRFSQKHNTQVYIWIDQERSSSGKTYIELTDFSKEVPVVREALLKRDSSSLKKQYSGVIAEFLKPEIKALLSKSGSLSELENAKKILSHLKPHSGSLQCQILKRETELSLEQRFEKATKVVQLKQIKNELDQPVSNCYVVKRDTHYKKRRYHRYERKYSAANLEETIEKGEVVKAEHDNVKIYRGRKQENNWVSVERKSLFGHKVYYSKNRLVGEFDLLDPRDLKPLKPVWSKKQRLALNKTIKNFNYRDFKLADQKKFKNAKQRNTVRAYQVYLKESPNGLFKKEAKKGLIQSYRRLNDFDGFVQAFKLSGEPKDISSAYKVARTDKEKSYAEKIIVKALPFSKIFKVDVSNKSESALKKSRKTALFHAMKAQTKDIARTVKVSVRQDIPFPIKYAEYRFNLTFAEILDYKPPIKGRGKDFVKQTLSFNLSKENGWQQSKVVTFKNIPVYGTYRPSGVGVLNFVGKIFGGKQLSKDALDVDFKLRRTRFEYRPSEIE